MAQGPGGIPERIVIAGGDLTEIAFALGAGDRIVGVDATSTWPEDTADLPQIGYVRQLSAESVLSLAPDLVLAADHAGPETALDQLRAAGVEVAVAPEEQGVEAIAGKIAFVGGHLGLEGEAATLSAAFTERLEAVKAKVAQLEERPSVLFIMTIRDGRRWSRAARPRPTG